MASPDVRALVWFHFLLLVITIYHSIQAGGAEEEAAPEVEADASPEQPQRGGPSGAPQVCSYRDKAICTDMAL